MSSYRKSSYRKFPSTHVRNHSGELLAGYDAIMDRIRAEYEKAPSADYLISIDTYPGVDDKEVLDALRLLGCRHLFDMRTVFRSEQELAALLHSSLTDDRVFGRMYFGDLEDLMDPAGLSQMRDEIRKARGITIVYGFGAFLAAPPAGTGGQVSPQQNAPNGMEIAGTPGASAVHCTEAKARAPQPTFPVEMEIAGSSSPGALAASKEIFFEKDSIAEKDADSGKETVRHSDLNIYLDMARWEIQLRYRRGMPNYNCSNSDEDILRKFKRGYFIEWRVADRHKMRWFDSVDYFMDTNRAGEPKMVPASAVRDALRQLTLQPFRTVPYFDPGVWGGQWMKEVCDLDRSKPNYAWSFDGVPEENSLLLDFGNGIFELPAIDLVLTHPRELLGEKVYARFGAEFPIRFDFLDTIGGQNLSLQVHPVTDYIRRCFGMAYTQDESYYILDAGEGACVYLGLTEGADPEEMFSELERANRGECIFDAEKYVNRFPAKKHDHFLIPAGTCHGAGAGTMVLEISATPYIFTFKLWDWGRLGLDGKPRPVHLEHGRRVIRADRKTGWVKDNLVNAFYTVNNNSTYTEEHTGLHELEFIETRRYRIRERADLDTAGNVSMLNLVEGSAALIESPAASFEPFTVYYAETFILPASAGAFSIRPLEPGGNITVIRAYVRV